MPAESHARDLKTLISTDAWRLQVLQAVADLGLPDCWIGAGFVRSAVWDRLHGHGRPTLLADIDVVYHDPCDPSSGRDQALARILAAHGPKPLWPQTVWSVKNQARMHAKHGHRPYGSVEAALRHWPETATAVALRMQAGGDLALLAPFGLADLFGLVLCPTPHARRYAVEVYRARLAEKNWLANWPRLTIVTP